MTAATAEAPARTTRPRMTQAELPLADVPRRQPARPAPPLANSDTRRWTLDRTAVERARVLANLTYEQLAAAAHVDRATLRDMLGQRRRSTLGSVHAVIRALNLDPATVLVVR